jgi:hypothetical protein
MVWQGASVLGASGSDSVRTSVKEGQENKAAIIYVVAAFHLYGDSVQLRSADPGTQAKLLSFGTFISRPKSTAQTG